MGQLDILPDTDDEAPRRRFARAVLDDLVALERMLGAGMFESGVRRIGAEQELFLIDPAGRPLPVALPLLDRLADPRFTTEIAQFNLEYNVDPQVFGAGCLLALERDLADALERARSAAALLGGDLLLVGTLPSIELTDLTLDRMTPLPRYRELNRAVMRAAGGEVRTLIAGADELQVVHDNVMLEACNTSFQIHWQTGADEFPVLYNLAQLVAGPVLAAAVNSPLLLQRRLWHETRIALFQQSLDFRSVSGRQRDTWQRVSFGSDWVQESVLEIYRDQVARHGVLLMGETGSSTAALDRGEVPGLRALCLHNGSVYRWNRVCYGVTEGRPHLRIEHRPLPSGPTVLDEVANAALFFGLLAGLVRRYGDPRREFGFADVKANFIAAARYGLGSSMRWGGQGVVPARALLLEELLPVARAGLAAGGIPAAEAGRYLDVVEERVRNGRTGAQWQLDLYDRTDPRLSRVVRSQAVVRAMLEQERSGDPVGRWPLPEAPVDRGAAVQVRTVGQVMSTDLFTMRPDDLVDVAAAVMDWKHVRHVPVEDDEGRLVGLLSYRALLRGIAVGGGPPGVPRPVRALMDPDPVTIDPEASCADAIALLRDRRVSCLLVVHRGRLVGIASERDFLGVAYDLLTGEGKGR